MMHNVKKLQYLATFGNFGVKRFAITSSIVVKVTNGEGGSSL